MVNPAIDSWSKIRKRRLEKNFTKLECLDRLKNKQEEEIRKAKEFYQSLGKCGFTECLSAYIVAKTQIRRNMSLGATISDDLTQKFSESEHALYHE